MKRAGKRPWELSRRAFLGGAGAMIGLPLLEAMIPGVRRLAMAQDTPPPQRMLYYYVPNGIHMPAWTPTRTGRDYDTPLILEPLAELTSHISVLTGISNTPAEPDGPGDHASGTGAFLTAMHPFKTEGADIANGISVDQVAVNALQPDTRFSSLQLGVEGGASVGGCDSGYSCAYSRNISWSGPATPLPKMVNPQLVFDRLFGGATAGDTLAEIERRTRLRASVLDYVVQDANRLSARLGASDRLKVDEYLTGVRELERSIQALDDAPTCRPPEYPGFDIDIDAHVRVMTDLMVVAMRCDLTRVISFMFANAGSNRYYAQLDGVGGGHHDVSHHQDSPANFRQLETIGRWEVDHFAYLLESMASVEEGEGTLLDNSLVFFSSEIEDGNSHSHDNLPILLAGRAAGAFEPGEHVRWRDEPEIADLFISILGMFDVQVDTFGLHGTGPLAGLGPT